MNGSGSLLHMPSDYALGMKRQPKYRWWKPIFAAALAAGLTCVLLVVSFLAFGIISGMSGGPGAMEFIDIFTKSDMSLAKEITTTDIIMLAMTFISIALFAPAAGIGSKIMGLGGLRGLSSVEGGLRWDRMRSLIAGPVIVMILLTFVEMAIAAFTEPGGLGEFRFAPAIIIVTLLLCPLQCAGEEYLFRGLALQVFSSWIPAVIIPVILQAVLFAVMHGYNSLGFIATLGTGLVTAWLTLKTGGLEAAICLHTANNVVAFIGSSLFVTIETTSNVSMEALIVSVAGELAMAAVLYWQCKRKGYLLEQR